MSKIELIEQELLNLLCEGLKDKDKSFMIDVFNELKKHKQPVIDRYHFCVARRAIYNVKISPEEFTKIVIQKVDSLPEMTVNKLPIHLAKLAKEINEEAQLLNYV